MIAPLIITRYRTEGRNYTETETKKRKRNGVDRGKHRVDQVPADPPGHYSGRQSWFAT